MNKKLIALAIATAVSAPAMAASSNVEVYGLMSAAVESVDNAYLDANGNAQTHRVGRIADHNSRIGFKGAEDLGNGLSGIWQIEQGFKINGGQSDGSTSSTGGAFGGAGLRNTFVGLKSNDMGTAMVGNFDTPYKASTGRLDPFADTLGDYRGLMGAAAGSSTTANKYFAIRAANILSYTTPNFSGFTATGAYVFGNATATNQADTTANAYSLAAMYDAGPLFLTAAYEKHNFGSTGVGTFAGGANTDEKAWKLGAGYNIMDTTLAAIYEKTDDNRGPNGANLYGHHTFYVSVKQQMGAIALKAAFAKAGSTDASNTGAKQYSLGADYAFSKRTAVYALYSKIDNEKGASYNYEAAAPVITAAGANLSGFSLGVKHSF